MSNCLCGNRGAFNFRPTPQPAIDCFFMMKVNQVFSGCYESVLAEYQLIDIVSPTGIVPVQPFTFVSANSASDMSVVTSIEQLPDNVVRNDRELNRFQIDITVPTDLAFTDNNGVTFFSHGTVNLRVEVVTPLSDIQISESGMALAIAAFEAVSGIFTSGTSFTLIISGSIDIVFVCPSLLRLRHEGECNFMPPLGEGVTVISEETNSPDLRRFLR